MSHDGNIRYVVGSGGWWGIRDKKLFFLNFISIPSREFKTMFTRVGALTWDRQLVDRGDK